tara:strand:+ start:573 stop:884 length:312 start_codon:yes stop_codon:yes gene_type:complete
MIGIEKALQVLTPNAQFAVYGDGTIDWLSPDIEQPTEEAVQAKLTELQAEYDSKQYQRDRKYPDLGEQFDLLFKDIDSGKVSKDGGFYKAIKAVKDAHPKPSE